MEEEILQKISKLTNELASQQQNNRDLASGLTTQLSELKSKADTKYSTDEHYVHIPNPLLPEQRDQVLHDLKTRLEKAVQEQQTTMIANQQLEKEIQDLQLLVKEYEAGLEVATSKLRTHASAITEGQIRLRREYEALLNAEKGTTAALFMENTMLQTQLRQLSKSLRNVYREESVDDIHDQQISQLRKENEMLLELLKISRLTDLHQQQDPITERASPVLKVARTGIVEEFFE